MQSNVCVCVCVGGVTQGVLVVVVDFVDLFIYFYFLF